MLFDGEGFKIMNITISSDFWLKLLWFFIAVVSGIMVGWILTFLNKELFRRIRKKTTSIHIAYLERVIAILIVLGITVLVFSALDGTSSVWKTMLGGTAVLSAVAAFAGQDIIKDLLAGLMISIQKPFEIGDRIELEDGTAGVVEDMTSRHVVLIRIDTLRIVIPNSRINTMILQNYSFHRPTRAVHFKFSVGYNSDMALVKRVIARAVEESDYSVPGKTDAEGKPAYGGVYFLSFADSALIMGVTVYYEKNFPTELIINDINTRVREALIANGIEIPYNYVNVITNPDKPND